MLPDFIQSDAEHIRGTECDQKILSKRESSGMLFSPNYPFPYQTNIVCRYFVYGMQDEQNLERVILQFEKFNVPMADSRCNDGYLKVSQSDRHLETSDVGIFWNREICRTGVHPRSGGRPRVSGSRL